MTSTSVCVFHISKIYRIKCDASNGNKHVVFGVYESKNITLRNICVIIPIEQNFEVCSVNILKFVTKNVVELI